MCSCTSSPHRGWFATHNPLFLDLPHSFAWKTNCRKMCLSQHPAGDPSSILSSKNGRNATNDDNLLLLFIYITFAKMHTVETEYINLSVCSHIVKTFFLCISYQWYLHSVSKGKGYSICQWDHHLPCKTRVNSSRRHTYLWVSLKRQLWELTKKIQQKVTNIFICKGMLHMMPGK